MSLFENAGRPTVGREYPLLVNGGSLGIVNQTHAVNSKEQGVPVGRPRPLPGSLPAGTPVLVSDLAPGLPDRVTTLRKVQAEARLRHENPDQLAMETREAYWRQATYYGATRKAITDAHAIVMEADPNAQDRRRIRIDSAVLDSCVARLREGVGCGTGANFRTGPEGRYEPRPDASWVEVPGFPTEVRAPGRLQATRTVRLYRFPAESRDPRAGDNIRNHENFGLFIFETSGFGTTWYRGFLTLESLKTSTTRPKGLDLGPGLRA